MKAFPRSFGAVAVVALVINVAIFHHRLMVQSSEFLSVFQSLETKTKLESVTTIKVDGASNNIVGEQDGKKNSSSSIASDLSTSINLEFVHIPKTGGSAIELAGAKANISWGLCHWQQRPLAGPGCAVAKEENSFKHAYYSWEMWHTPPSLLKNISSPYEGKELFAVVRNPYTRFISQYYCPYHGFNPVRQGLKDAIAPEAFRQEGKTISHPKPETPETLNKFLKRRLGRLVKSTAHYLPQTDFIYDERGDQVVRHVLRFENLTAQFAELMANYRLPLYLNATVNGSRTKQKRMSIKDLYPETIRLINRVAERDFRLFGYEMLEPVAGGKKRELAS